MTSPLTKRIAFANKVWKQLERDAERKKKQDSKAEVKTITDEANLELHRVGLTSYADGREYARKLQSECPWIGKEFNEMTEEELLTFLKGYAMAYFHMGVLNERYGIKVVQLYENGFVDELAELGELHKQGQSKQSILSM